MAADDATGAMWCHPCSVMANYRCQLHCESGTGLPLLGVLSSHRISRFFALSEVGKVKRELPTLGGSTPDFMIARSFSHLADVSDSTFQPATDRYGKHGIPMKRFASKISTEAASRWIPQPNTVQGPVGRATRSTIFATRR